MRRTFSAPSIRDAVGLRGRLTQQALTLQPPLTRRDEAAIRNVVATSVEAWNKHDANAFARVFADEADFKNVRGMSAHGRAAIAKFHAPIFATSFKDSPLNISDSKIRFIKPDVAAVDAWWEMTGAKPRDGQDLPLRKGLLSFVMTTAKSQWFITVMHNTDLPACP